MMSLLDDLDDDPDPLVNVYEFYRSHGIINHTASMMILHLLLTRTFCSESDAREVASEFNIDIPFVFKDTGTMH